VYHARVLRWLAICLAVVVGLFAFETGVHAVHHLGEIDRPDGGCVVASAAAHLDAAAGATIGLPVLALVVVHVLAERATPPPPVRAPARPPGRGPPPALLA
jgi:hypothetical protein